MPPAERKGQVARRAPRNHPFTADKLRALDASHVFEDKQSKGGRGISTDVRKARDLSRYVRWPHYINLQRKRRVLYKRLKVPPMIAQFTKTADKNHATTVFKVLDKYRPEEDKAKAQRLLKAAQERAVYRKSVEDAKKDGKKAPKAPKAPKKKVSNVKIGINNVVRAVERQKAKLVLIAHDVDPVEMVLWLPALCRKKNVPYIIVKGKARLGAVVRQKICATVAITNVEKEDIQALTSLVDYAKESFNEKYEETRKTFGGLELSQSARHAADKRRKLQTQALSAK